MGVLVLETHTRREAVDDRDREDRGDPARTEEESMSELQRKPQAGDKRITVAEYRRRSCHYCGEDATRRVTYLLDRARINRQSSAYGKDDCSWCSDGERHVCEACVGKAEHDAPEGMGYCATFDGRGERFSHMVHEWVQIDQAVVPADVNVQADRFAVSQTGSGS